MKLTKANEQKLFITKARLWANVYRAVTGSLNRTTSSQYDIANAASQEADRAVKSFDERFTQKLEAPTSQVK